MARENLTRRMHTHLKDDEADNFIERAAAEDGRSVAAFIRRATLRDSGWPAGKGRAKAQFQRTMGTAANSDKNDVTPRFKGKRSR